VDSAGTSPINWISDHARQFLERENASKYLKTRPEGLETRRPRDYDLIVAMEVKHRFSILHRCPECADRIEVWDIDDPYDTSAEYEEEVYQQIKTKVEELAQRLSKKSLPRIG
jgi:protein-tyrosine-phosphatase